MRRLHTGARNRQGAAQTSVIPVNTLAFSERRALLLLRIEAHPESSPRVGEEHIFANMPDELRKSYADVAREAVKHELMVLLPRSPFLSKDENTLLHRLSALQRPSQSGRWILANDLQRALSRCAELLAENGRRLPPRPALLEPEASASPSLRIVTADEGSGSEHGRKTYSWRRRMWDGSSEPAPGTLVDRALQIVRTAREAKTAEFLAAGITYQYLSALRKLGYVERVSHGVYCYPRRLTK